MLKATDLAGLVFDDPVLRLDYRRCLLQLDHVLLFLGVERLFKRFNLVLLILNELLKGDLCLFEGLDLGLKLTDARGLLAELTLEVHSLILLPLELRPKRRVGLLELARQLRQFFSIGIVLFPRVL